MNMAVDKNRKKHPGAVALGKLGGRKGGLARAKSLTKERRQEIARIAGAAGGKARAANMTAKQRSASGRNAANARHQSAGR
jgi:hypothetical protein